MLLMIMGVFLFSFIYYLVGTRLFGSMLSYYEYLVLTIVISITVVGGYQIFFWVQRNNYFFKTRCFKISLDDMIPFWPSWIWVYNLIYYIMIGFVIVSVKSLEYAIFLIFGGLVLLFLQSILFMLLPAVVPPEWRAYKTDSLSARYLKFTQRVDNGRNCFPSMHISLSTYIGLILYPTISYWAWIFVLFIILSSLFVKQHQVVDIVPGVILGWFVYLLVI